MTHLNDHYQAPTTYSILTPAQLDTKRQPIPRSRQRIYYKALQPNVGYYDDFKCIDWNRDTVRQIEKQMERKTSWNNKFIWACLELILHIWDWALILLIGIITGAIFVLIKVSSKWLASFREGICIYNFAFDQKECCWISSDYNLGNDCSDFLLWSDILGIPNDMQVVNAIAYIFNYLLYTIIGTLMATIAASNIQLIAPYACGSGISELKTILSGYVFHGYLGVSTLIGKIGGVILSIGSGLSVGLESPMVHIACCIGNVLSRLSMKYRGNEAKKRELLSVAVAAGISVAFSAPIGGVLFSFEEINYYCPLNTLWKALSAAVAGVYTVRLLSPNPQNVAHFLINYDAHWNVLELLPFILIGIVGGIYGALFIKLNIAWNKYRKKYSLASFPILETFIIAMLTAFLAFPNPFTRVESSLVVSEVTSRCSYETDGLLCAYNITDNNNDNNNYLPRASTEIWMTVSLLFAGTLFKIATTVITFGTNIPTGLFLPTMYIGASFGRVVGILIEQLVITMNDSGIGTTCELQNGYFCITPGIYAIVGAGAFLAGVNRMTVTLAVILFEMTGDLSYIIPIMVTIATAKMCGDCLGTRSIYEEYIYINKQPFVNCKEEYKENYTVGEVLKVQAKYNNMVCISAIEMTVSKIQDIIDSHSFWGFPCVLTYESQILIGYVVLHDLKLALREAWAANRDLKPDTPIYFTECRLSRYNNVIDFTKVLDSAQIQVTHKMPMYNVVKLFQKIGLKQILVTEQGRAVGILTKKDIVAHLTQIWHPTTQNRACLCFTCCKCNDTDYEPIF